MASEVILLVDDDPDMREILRVYLQKNGYKVILAKDGIEAIEVLELHHPDLIILDVVMPKLDGFEVCQHIRKKSEVPILFLSSKEEDMDKILGLGVGGDDFISKTTSPAVIVAKIKAHLRRNRIFPTTQNRDHKPVKKPSVLVYPGLEINLDSTTVKLNGTIVKLAAKEFQILSLLAQNPERVYSVEKLFELIWGEDSLGDYRTVMVHISNLRKKIEANPDEPMYIQTIRGIGYKFIDKSKE
ncbi:DNA-binding response regulator, OmpR family, contains REC and winged-helix (wHTH) domain [Oceanobacillus limi]|uniref:DNA-binding response regulator, OmpR family, contains REC and winged-helix (WHTH) domain n=1 Tax=Oceanobacillus limi TaxID=930131 RepID=A0A1I0BFP5_9BACI|nr:response regulator transcription factor [Oceanobacillus limi]SET05763.1 DNA-binding response regulator, OmpR family, contains REC and winged-helix (wHTH) domain [Oceanobacillus limi]